MNTTIEKIKKGDLFKVVSKSKGVGASVYVADGFNRSTRKYSAYKFEDVSHFRDFKKGTVVTENFTF